jgi:sugar lactone lactonase YvrE
LDKATGWLYVVDHGGQRVLRLNTNTGAVSGAATEWMVEAVAEYTDVTGYQWEEIISEGLVQPAGIEIVGSHLYVSDHANGDVIIYDLSGPGAVESGRLHTGTPGLMGIAAGPDGRIWGVNATYSQLLRLDPQEPTGMELRPASRPLCWPVPANDRLFLDRSIGTGPGRYTVHDAVGRELLRGSITALAGGVDTRTLPVGAYSLVLSSEGSTRAYRFSVAR